MFHYLFRDRKEKVEEVERRRQENVLIKSQIKAKGSKKEETKSFVEFWINEKEFVGFVLV